jgi:hypothetical protein
MAAWDCTRNARGISTLTGCTVGEPANLDAIPAGADEDAS